MKYKEQWICKLSKVTAVCFLCSLFVLLNNVPELLRIDIELFKSDELT